MNSSHALYAAVACLVLMASSALAENDGRSATDPCAAEANSVSSVAVAIMDFESKAPGNPDLGNQVSDILTARLSIYDQFRLVERKKLEQILKEHEMNLTGIVETDQAVKVGKLVGARILIFGRAFTVDKDLYFVVKIIGTETSRVKGVLVKGNMESNVSEIIDKLVDKLVDALDKWTPQLLPKNEKLVNKITELKGRLKGRTLPTVAVVVREAHVSRRIVDPAAETEIRQIFQQVGFTVLDVKKDTGTNEDPYLRDADIIITGEGFSEFGVRIGGLVSCLARLEVQATLRNSRKVITSQRTTRRAVDLSEAIASKTALQAAGHELAIKLIEAIEQQADMGKNAGSGNNKDK